MVKHLKLTELPLTYLPKFREYGLQYTDGGSSFQVIHYGPWCGQLLPHRLRHQWFEVIERLGLELVDDDIPEEYQSEEWYLQELAFG